MLLAFCVILLAFVNGAQPERLVNLQSLPANSFLTNLNREKLLKYAKDVKLVYECATCKNASDVQAQMKRNSANVRKAKLLAIAFRNGDFVSGLLFKRSENKYLLAFGGSYSDIDMVQCANIGSSGNSSQGLLGSIIQTFMGGGIEDLRKQDVSNYGADYDISTHDGFYEAGRSALETLANAIQKDATPGLPVRIHITGHSMGGALAFQAAYFFKKVLARRLGLAPEDLQLGIATFAAAGYFHKTHFKKACDVIGQHNALVLRRPGDFAVDFSSRFDFYSPACVVQLDFDAGGFAHSVDDYEATIRDWSDPGIKRFNTLCEKALGRRTRTYPKWKPLIKNAKLRLRHSKANDSSDSSSD